MYAVIDNDAYMVVINACKTVNGSHGAHKATEFHGWAVDKIRGKALDIVVETGSGVAGNGGGVVGSADSAISGNSSDDAKQSSDGIEITRYAKPDIRNMVTYDMGERVGFCFVLVAPLGTVRMTIHTPIGDVTKTIDMSHVAAGLNAEHTKYLAKRLIHFGLRAWRPSVLRSLLGTVKRRFFPQFTRDEYDRWIEQHETMQSAYAQSRIQSFKKKPLVSVVTPVYNVDERWLRKCVESMQNQWYNNWELCLADDCSPDEHIKPLLEQLSREDNRIKVVFREENGGIAAATNSAIELASGELVGFMDNDDELAPHALYEIVRAYQHGKDLDFFYSDEDKIDENGKRFGPFFKPNFSPNLLLSHNYITHFVVVSRDLLDKVGPLDSTIDGSQDYDFVLKATELAKRVVHIPKMLYHWRTIETSVAGDPRSKMYAYEAGRIALVNAYERRSVDAEVSKLEYYGTYKTVYKHNNPSVVVFVSSLSDYQMTLLKQQTAYKNVRFVRFDNVRVDGDGASSGAAFGGGKLSGGDPNGSAPSDDASTVRSTKDRSLIETINAQAKSAKEDYCVFLDAVVPKNKHWLGEFVNYALAQGVGVVGGSIYSRDGLIDNIGITLPSLISGQPFESRGRIEEGIGYFFRYTLPRDMFAVTENCMITSRELFNQCGGFDSDLVKGLRGIDYCVRARKIAGKSVLFEPYSQFVCANNKQLFIDKQQIERYLNSNRNLQDPISSQYVEDASVPATPMQYNIDDVEFSGDGRSLTIRGWAVNLNSRGAAELGVIETQHVTVESIERSVRPDVSLHLQLPETEELGFTLKVRLNASKTAIFTPPIELVITAEETKMVVKIPSNALIKKVKKIKGLTNRHYVRAILASKRYQLNRARSYQKLIAHTEDRDAAAINKQIAEFRYKPLISIVMPVYNVDKVWLARCIDSIEYQSYKHWELCIADDCSTKDYVRAFLNELQAANPKIKVVFREQNGHISAATNSALTLATGEFVGLMDNDDELPPDALFEVVKALNENPELDLIYTDEDKIDCHGRRSDPHFKPDYSPDLLWSTNYISHFGVYRRSIVEQIGGFRVGYEGSQDYDLVLRFMEHSKPERVAHISKVLYHWRMLPTSTAASGSAKDYTSQAGYRALLDAVNRSEVGGTLQPHPLTGMYNVHYTIAHEDLVSVIIPTKNGYDNIERCVTSILEKTTYTNYEIIIADNGSTLPQMQELYDRFAKQLGERWRVERIDMPFNFSTINNIAARGAKGKYLLFLNDDTQVISADWMTRMVSFAQLERVGVVGAKLLYPNNTIQHAGVALGLGGAAGHVMYSISASDSGYFGRLLCNVNYYAVTAACCMVKAEDFWAVNGFDESFKVAFNDVDFCVRIHDELHKDNLVPHEVCLYHYESLTRGSDKVGEERIARLKAETERFCEKYRAIVERDPYYNPNFSLASNNYDYREV